MKLGFKLMFAFNVFVAIADFYTGATAWGIANTVCALANVFMRVE